MIPLAVPNLEGNESAYLKECIDTAFVSSVGPFVTRFEKQIAQSSGAAHAVTTSSGTTALHLALLAAGVKPGDLVVIPSFTFIATANAVSHCGATPWLMDIEAQGWTLDPEQLKREFKANLQLQNGQAVHRATSKRVAAIMPVHVLGNPAELDAISSIAAEYSIPIVADGAAALGATLNGKSISRPGILTTFSFNGNKTITCGGGGAVTSDSESHIAHIRHISSTARVGTDYHHDEIGFNFRMTNIQAAVGCAQIERLAAFVQRKREIDRHYRNAVETHAHLASFPRPPWGKSACWFSGVVLPEKSDFSVSELQKLLREADVESRPFWKPIHLQPPYRDAPRADLRLSESIWSRILTLPCSTGITNSELSTVANTLLAQWSAKSA